VASLYDPFSSSGKCFLPCRCYQCTYGTSEGLPIIGQSLPGVRAGLTARLLGSRSAPKSQVSSRFPAKKSRRTSPTHRPDSRHHTWAFQGGQILARVIDRGYANADNRQVSFLGGPQVLSRCGLSINPR